MAVTAAASPPTERRCARIILVDDQQRLLLFASRMPDGSPGRLWAAPGGGVESGETWEQTAHRELREETGLDLPVGPWLWHREHTWLWAAKGTTIRSVERYFLVRTPTTSIDTSAWTPVERDVLVAHHWWTVDELLATHDVIAPRTLAQLLPPILAGHLPDPPLVLRD